jgi:hypothetical protein
MAKLNLQKETIKWMNSTSLFLENTISGAAPEYRPYGKYSLLMMMPIFSSTMVLSISSRKPNKFVDS